MTPPKSGGNRPVYRYAPRSHVYNCPCNRCVQVRERNKGDWGGIGTVFLICLIVMVVGFWPAMVWHGQNATGGWRWDVHSTIGCCIWWGSWLIVVFAFGVSNKSARGRPPRPPKGRLPVEVMPYGSSWRPPAPQPKPSGCRHLNAVPWWNRCPDCDEQLPEDFGRGMRPCCGTPPGADHGAACPEAGEVRR